MFMDRPEILIESRLTKVEVKTEAIADDIKDIKKTLKWILGVIFSLNSTIIGILTKGFGVL